MAYTDNGKLRVVYGDYVLGVHGKGFDYTFSYAQGGLESIVKNGYEWLYRCPKPTFWRALTDNDRGSKFHIKSGSWMAADTFIDCKNVEVIMIENSQSYQKEYVLHHVEGGLYATDIMIPFSGSWEINAVIEDSQMFLNRLSYHHHVHKKGDLLIDLDFEGDCARGDLPSIIPTKLFLIHEDPH